MTDPNVPPPPPPAGAAPPPPAPSGGFAAPPPPAGGFGAPVPGATAGGALQLELNAPLEVARWRPLIHWLLVFPFAIVTGFLYMGLSIVAFLAFFTVVFTKRIPDGIWMFGGPASANVYVDALLAALSA